MEELKKQINTAIEKDLPNQIGTVLKEKLAQAEKDAEEIITLRKQVEKFEKSKKEMIEEINQHNSLDFKKREIEAQEKTLNEKKRDQRVFEAELKVKEADKRAEEMYGIVQTVFKSPVYRKNSFGNASSYDANGYLQNHPTNNDETFSEE